MSSINSKLNFSDSDRLSRPSAVYMSIALPAQDSAQQNLLVAFPDGPMRTPKRNTLSHKQVHSGKPGAGHLRERFASELVIMVFPTPKGPTYHPVYCGSRRQTPFRDWGTRIRFFAHQCRC